MSFNEHEFKCLLNIAEEKVGRVGSLQCPTLGDRGEGFLCDEILEANHCYYWVHGSGPARYLSCPGTPPQKFSPYPIH